MADDKAYLDTILAHYIDRPMQQMETVGEQYEDWNVKTAADSLKDSVDSYRDALTASTQRMPGMDSTMLSPDGT